MNSQRSQQATVNSQQSTVNSQRLTVNTDTLSRTLRPILFRRRLLVAILCVLIFWSLDAGVLLAHGGENVTPQNVWRAWNWDPFILFGLVLSGWAYGRGVRSLWRRAGIARGVEFWRVFAFAAGLVVLFIALISPLDALSGALFSAHMVQHLLLILVTAPLLVLGAPPFSLIWALPKRWRPGLGHWWRRQTSLAILWRFLTRPFVVWLLNMAVLWFWHMPPFYQAALQNEWIHAVEHASFLAAALLFWWTLAQCGGYKRLSHGAGVLFLFATSLHGGLLGWLLSFTPKLWYPAYVATAPVWGVTALEDQQLAGLIMWMPAGAVYAIAGVILMGVWLEGLEREDRRRREQALTPKDRRRQQTAVSDGAA